MSSPEEIYLKPINFMSTIHTVNSKILHRHMYPFKKSNFKKKCYFKKSNNLYGIVINSHNSFGEQLVTFLLNDSFFQKKKKKAPKPHENHFMSEKS